MKKNNCIKILVVGLTSVLAFMSFSNSEFKNTISGEKVFSSK